MFKELKTTCLKDDSSHTMEFIFSDFFSSGQFSRSVMSDCLWPHESQHARPPCPSPTPGVYPNSCPLSRRCHPAISFSVVPFSSCLQSLPSSESFPMSQLFTWGGQSTGVSASASSPSKEIPGLISFRINLSQTFAYRILQEHKVSFGFLMAQ